jgi:hypothetical protein
MIRETGQRVDTLEIVVWLVGERLTPPISVSVLIGQDACTASMDPISGLFFAVSCYEAGREGLGCALVV